MSTRQAAIELLSGLSFNDYLNAIAEAGKAQNQNVNQLIIAAVAENTQAHLDAVDYQATCPECGSAAVKKNGKRNGTQRYACKECGHRFTSTSGTILEKTQYSWDIWVEVIKCMLNNISIDKTIEILKDDYHAMDISVPTVWRMRIKVLNAIAALPSPVLSGNIQFDDTFIRESQKASHTLITPLPNDIKKEREPRYGRVPSVLGVRGNEFATVSCAIDETGHAVARVLGTGVIAPDVMYDFISEHTNGIAYAQTDADTTYAEVFRTMNVPHYIKPSKYWDIIKAAGYEQPSKKDELEAAAQVENNRAILETLYAAKKIDHIANRGTLSFAEFNDIKRSNNLSLGRVNEFHNEIKNRIEKATTSVGTKWLPMYVAWCEYLHNRVVDGKGIASTKDAEDILIAAFNTRKNITVEEIEAIREQPLQLPKASGKYIHLLNDKTNAVRKASGNDKFKFGDEDKAETFDYRKVLASMTNDEIIEVAKAAKVPYSRLTRTKIIHALYKVENISEIVYTATIADAKARKTDSDSVVAAEDMGHGNREVNNKTTFTPAMFTRPTAEKKVAFIDVETTGLNTKTDEVLSVAIVNSDGEVLYDKLFKPEHRIGWKKAQEINGIAPATVKNKKPVRENHKEIEHILAGFDIIAGWNVRFDLNMLYSNGVDMPQERGKYVDLMPMYGEAVVAGTSKQPNKKHKLEDAADDLGLKYKAHTALGDTKVLLPIWDYVVERLAA